MRIFALRQFYDPTLGSKDHMLDCFFPQVRRAVPQEGVDPFGPAIPTNQTHTALPLLGGLGGADFAGGTQHFTAAEAWAT